jgi:microcystin-dependent protein
MFAGNFAPDGWQFCNGQLLPINQNQALFSIIGTTYGGDGQQTFGLPNLQGRAPIHWGSGSGVASGLTTVVGQTGGTSEITLNSSTMPAHTHQLVASGGPPTLGDPTTAFLSEPLRNGPPLYAVSNGATNTPLLAASVATAGGGQPMGRIQPYLVVSFIISLFGVFPSRN